MTAAPLQGVRVLDLAAGPLGAVGRTLAELGADVVRVEPRQGGADRAQGPSVGGVGLAYAAANLGKRAVGLDLEDAADRRVFETLVANADILIETTRPKSPQARALDAHGLRKRRPALVILSISDLGTGAYADWQATDLVLQALSGELSRSGLPGRAPLPPPGELAIQCAAAQGVYVVLAAYLHRLQTGEGDLLDFSLLDAAAQTLDPGYGIAGSAASGVPASQLPRGRPDVRAQYPIIPCKDGFVRLCILAPRQWQGMFAWMGSPAEFADPAFNGNQHRFASPTLLPHIAAFFADKTRAEIEAAGERYRVPAAGLLTLDEALASEQTRARRSFAEFEVASGVHAPFPNGVVEVDGRRAAPLGPAPSLSESPAAVLEAWSRPRPKPTGQLRFGKPGRPLAGLRVLDLGVIVVGSEQGRLLADYGAEVIKVENAAFPDGSRGGGQGVSVTFAAGHRNKKGLGLNLREPEGRELFLRLIEQSDIVLSNFKPGTLESLDLSPTRLMAHNPQLILLDSSAFGSTGPASGRMGYGPLVRASAGLTAQWRYTDDPGSFSDAMTIYPDHVAARVGIAGVLALLIRAWRTTGQGGSVSVSQTEVMLSHMAGEIAALALMKRGVALDAEHSRDAPWGVFPCVGDDEWCVVSVRGDADWKALCDVIDRADLVQDPALATALGRADQRRRVDAAVGAWFAQRSPKEAMLKLQGAGVPAAAMLRVSELPDFPYYQERELLRRMSQPQFEAPFFVDNLPVRSERLTRPPLAPAPVMGEHTVEIAHDLLGLSREKIADLVNAKILELPMPAAAPSKI